MLQSLKMGSYVAALSYTVQKLPGIASFFFSVFIDKIFTSLWCSDWLTPCTQVRSLAPSLNHLSSAKSTKHMTTNRSLLLCVRVCVCVLEADTPRNKRVVWTKTSSLFLPSWIHPPPSPPPPPPSPSQTLPGQVPYPCVLCVCDVRVRMCDSPSQASGVCYNIYSGYLRQTITQRTNQPLKEKQNQPC